MNDADCMGRRFMRAWVSVLISRTVIRSDRAGCPTSFSSNLKARVLATRGLLLFLAIVYSTLGGPRAAAQGQLPCNPSTPVVRPILFVHGWNEGTEAWGSEPLWSGTAPGSLRDKVITQMQQVPGYSNTGGNTDLYYDGVNVRISLGQTATSVDPVASTALIPCNSRFFSIRFSGWNSGTGNVFDTGAVNSISVVTKAYELSQVVKLITSVTYVQDVIVVAHSLGALDTRAYLEGLGYANSNNACASPVCPLSSYPLTYTDDIGAVITLDGTNAGSNLAYFGVYVPGLSSTNVAELQPNSPIIQALNYGPSYYDTNGAAVEANALNTPFVAIISEFSDTSTVPCVLSDNNTCRYDGAVASDSQSIQDPLMNHTTRNLTDVTNDFSFSDPTILTDFSHCYQGPLVILHLLPCLGDSHNSSFVVPNLIADSILANDPGQLTQVSIQTTDASGQNYTGLISFTLSSPWCKC